MRLRDVRHRPCSGDAATLSVLASAHARCTRGGKLRADALLVLALAAVAIAAVFAWRRWASPIAPPPGVFPPPSRETREEVSPSREWAWPFVLILFSPLLTVPLRIALSDSQMGPEECERVVIGTSFSLVDAGRFPVQGWACPRDFWLVGFIPGAVNLVAFLAVLSRGRTRAAGYVAGLLGLVRFVAPIAIVLAGDAMTHRPVFITSGFSVDFDTTTGAGIGLWALTALVFFLFWAGGREAEALDTRTPRWARLDAEGRESWDSGFEELKLFAAERGDTAVPLDYRAEGGFPLGQWVEWHRRRYAQGRLAGGRVRRLERLPEWRWESS